MSYNITVESGKSVRLPTAGKYCDRDIVVTAEDVGGDLSSGIDAMITNNVTDIDSKVTTLRDYACYGLASILTANFPNATRIGSMAFRACTKLYAINAPKVTTLGTYAFYTCSKLQKVDFPSLTAIPAACFQISSIFDTLILRSPTMVTLANTNALTSTPIANGKGYIYVPSALIDSYKGATNWSTYANQFRAIEDYPDICGG